MKVEGHNHHTSRLSFLGRGSTLKESDRQKMEELFKKTRGKIEIGGSKKRNGIGGKYAKFLLRISKRRRVEVRARDG